MAIELFKPFVMKELVQNGTAHNIKNAKKMVERLQPEVWDVLEEVIKEHPVMLNRAPTLHRLGIQAFEPILVEGKAIKLHPLVCTAYNADFDGDQMAVHLPLSVEAQAECRFMLLSPNNLLKPSDGGPVAVPSQDMVLGIYYLTQERPNSLGEGHYFKNLNEAILAYENGYVKLHSRIHVRVTKKMADGTEKTGTVESTLGRFIFNEILPQDLGFVDRSIPDWKHNLEDVRCCLDMLERETSNADEEENVRKLRAYLERNWEYLTPLAMREGLEEYQKGLGTCESNHRTYTCQMKKKGRRWSKDGGLAMVKVISGLKNGDLEQALAGEAPAEPAEPTPVSEPEPAEEPQPQSAAVPANGRTVLISGGDRGIGAAAARAFYAAGYRVAVLYHSNAEAAAALEAELPGITAVQCDVASRASCELAFRAAEQALGRVDVLVSNAGIAQQKLFTDITPEEWQRMLDVNLTGAFHLCQLALPGMIRRKAGRILTVSSMWGQTGGSCEVHYSAAKAGLIGLTKALAKEEGPSGITVNCVAPGVIETDMMAAFTAEDKAALAEETPVGRLGTADEVAKLLVFLAGEDAGYITGQVFGVNGGLVI